MYIFLVDVWLELAGLMGHPDNLCYILFHWELVEASPSITTCRTASSTSSSSPFA